MATTKANNIASPSVVDLRPVIAIFALLRPTLLFSSVFVFGLGQLARAVVALVIVLAAGVGVESKSGAHTACRLMWLDPSYVVI